MHNSMRTGDEKYNSLISPFKSVKYFTEADQETLLREESEMLDGTSFKIIGQEKYQRGTQVISAGNLLLIAGRTTPVISSNTSEYFSCFFAMPFMGSFTTRDGVRCDQVGSGDIYLNQNYYASSTIGYLSSLFVALDTQKLQRTMGCLERGASLRGFDSSIIIRGKQGKVNHGGSKKMWSLISFIDHLHGEDPYLPNALGLEEQFYRLLSITLLENTGNYEKRNRAQALQSRNWRSSLDELVDFIRAHPQSELTLTDLEEKSHYSARHLQNLFKEKFDCTPMQFVRRQRLDYAMERLQTADWDETVTSIGRDCGYRFTSNFTTDFHRQFGVTPSTVLRASRGG